MNRWQRLARQRQEERLITPYDPLCICGASYSEHDPVSGDPFDGSPHVCNRTGCAGFEKATYVVPN